MVRNAYPTDLIRVSVNNPIMNRPYLRAILIALITCLLGSGIDALTGLETTRGLDSLFQIRGARTPPAEAVVVAMDEASETRLGVGQDLTRWRGFHAQLIRQLQDQGAALVVFDLQFIAPNPAYDSALSAAMRKAGNVLVADCVQKFRRGVEDFYGREECSDRNNQPVVGKDGEQDQALSEQLVAMRRISPTTAIVESVLDHAPFYLPNETDYSTVHEAWTFFDALAETPGLPVVAWFYYLQRSGASTIHIPAGTAYSAWLTEQRRACRSGGDISANRQAKASRLEPRIDDVIRRGDSRYLDFYGPPQTLRMESYADVYDGKVADLRGKVVFVGKANRKFSPGKTDFFQTPYTETRSGKMAGVEIMATQFANLNEGRFVEAPFPPFLTQSLFGLVAGSLLIRFAGVAGIAASLGFGAIYAGLAVACFSRNGLWLPVAVPLLIQLPSAWLIAMLWAQRDLLNERTRILAFVRRVFPQWMSFLPATPGHWHPEQAATQSTSERDVAGLCLATDIEGYTAIAAHHTPREMWELLNAYYQVLGHPVSTRDGIIADVTGDAMMAVWIDLPVETQRLAACLAALEMKQAVKRFNNTSKLGPISTRIGLYEGDMTLGRLDAGKGSHFRAIGDTVNAASRIQGVNKFLGTHILASEAIATRLSNIYCRPVGSFALVGRKAPVALVEIVGLEARITTEQTAVYQKFARGLSAFQQGQWSEAASIFQTLLDEHGYDGPSRFYLNLALAYRDDPRRVWNGVVTLSEK
jgi:adenylate cyclase